MKIYLDILLIGNFTVTALCVRLLSKLTRIHISGRRTAVCGAVGAAGSLLIVICPQNTAEQLAITLIRIAIAVSVTVIAVGLGSRSKLIKCFIIYSLCDIVLCGVCTALRQITGTGMIITRNGKFYIALPLWIMILTTCGAYLLLTVCDRLTSYYFAKQKACKARYTLGGSSFTLPAVCDSGNLLRDCFSGRSVAVFSSDSLYCALGLDNEEDFTANGFHLVPYSTVNGSGLMPVTNKGAVEVIFPDGSSTELDCPAGFVKGNGTERAILDPRLIL